MPTTATAGGNLTLYNRPVSDWIYSYALSSAYRSPWVYDPSGALLDEPDVWEIVRNHPDILAEIIKRGTQVVRSWRIAPNYHASYTTRDQGAIDQAKRLAAICHEAIAHDGTLDEERTILSEAFFLGRRYGVTYWEKVTTSLDGTPHMEWWLPSKIKDLDRRRVHWVVDWAWRKPDGSRELVPAGSAIDYGGGRIIHQMAHPKGGYLEKVGTHLEIYNTDTYRWEKVSPEMRRNLIEYIYYDTEDRVGHGRGVLEALFFAHWWLSQTFVKIMQGIDRYANGILKGRLDTLRNASIDKTNVDMRSAMEDVLNTFRSEHYILLGDNDDVEVIDAPGKGMTISIEFARHVTASIARLCNGSVRPGGLSPDGKSGARAQASEEGDQSETYYQQPRNSIDHVIDRDLLGAFLYHNQENILKLGLADAKRPKFTSEQVKRQDPVNAIGVIKEALAAGMPLLKREAYDRIEFTPPSEEDDVLDPQATFERQQATMGDKLERDKMGKENAARAEKPLDQMEKLIDDL